MGKKRRIPRFLRWMKSDLPDDNKSVLLVGVTKIPSPTLTSRNRPHTVHLDHHVALNRNSQPCRTLSDDSIYEANNDNPKNVSRRTFDFERCKNKLKFIDHSPLFDKLRPKSKTKDKRVSFGTSDSQKLGFCKELPFEYYHPNRNGVERGIMDKSVDSIGSCSLDVDASSTDFSDSSVDSSNCTLRSLGVPTPIKETAAVSKISTDIKIETENKKPSYLNLACTVNGYSNITNYDSKHRDIFRIPRSREVSPIRPQDYHVTSTEPKSMYLTPNYKPSEMTENKSNYRTMTFMSKETTNFVKNMLHDDTDGCQNKLNGKYISYESKISQCSYLNGQEKTFSETTIKETFSSNRKSFIQQRVERLYGPAALAQGFFITNRMKNRNSESESSESFQEKSKTKIDEDNNVSPALPVLRHLRPEFRAQLPILSPKRSNYENSLQKSTTVPSSLTCVTNGEKKPVINTSKSVESIENKENIQKQIIIDAVKKDALGSKIIEDIPAAPQVILPITKPETNGVHNGEAQIKDGHFFLKTLKNETDRLIQLAEKVEDEMENKKTEIPEEVLGYLRSASGKARLLVSQKMQQFEGLCHKNINEKPGEPFPTTSEDLQGFWDMVMLQVTQVNQLFVEIDALRENKWIIPEKPKNDTVDASKTKKVLVKKTISASTEAQRKQREAARKKMIEERRKAMRDKQEQEKGIEIFVPESS